MAYSTGNPPAMVYQSVGGTFRQFMYKSTAAVATVTATTYISNGRDLGMRKNDLVTVIVDSTAAVGHASCSVLSTSTNGSVTLSTGVVIGSSK